MRRTGQATLEVIQDRVRLAPSRRARIAEGLESAFRFGHGFATVYLTRKEGEAETPIRFCVVGNIDCGHLLSHGTVEEVEKAVRKCIADAAPGGGFILSSSNSIHSSVNPRNYLAMVQAGKKKFTEESMRPQHTINSLHKDKDAIRGRTP